MKKLLTILILHVPLTISAFAQSKNLSNYFEGESKTDISLSYQRNVLKIGYNDAEFPAVSYTAIPLPAVAIAAISGGPAILITGGGIVLAGVLIDFIIGSKIESVTRNKSFKVKSKLYTKTWGEGKITGFIYLKGKKKCQDIKFSFSGLQDTTGSYELYFGDISEENKFGSLTDFGTFQSVALVRDLHYVSGGKKSTHCNWTLLEHTALDFNSI